MPLGPSAVAATCLKGLRGGKGERFVCTDSGMQGGGSHSGGANNPEEKERGFRLISLEIGGEGGALLFTKQGVYLFEMKGGGEGPLACPSQVRKEKGK